MIRKSEDTIAGIATPSGLGGIGIIRVSGNKSRFISRKIFRRRLSEDLAACGAELQSHRLTHGFISEKDGTALDEVFCVLMEAPNSYTCEDVLEIQCHSGLAVLNKILSLVLSCGARLAEPGEFTRRSFMNGRIDLSQAEAVADMINAKNETGLKLAARQLRGQTRQFVEAIVQRLDEFITLLQAAIEFGDELADEKTLCVQAEKLKAEIITPIQKVCSNYAGGRIYRDGLKLGIVGRPNVGKSSLLNRLLEQDKAIVTPYPGTTRDLVEDFLPINGIPITITDTAGLHLSSDPIEALGINKTRKYLQHSDMVLFVTDASQPFTAQDCVVFSEIPSQPVIIVVNKIDLMLCHRVIEAPDSFRRYPLAYISALHGDGVDNLRCLIAEQCKQFSQIKDSGEVVPNLRQKNALDNALIDLQRASIAIESELSEEFIVNDLISAKAWLKNMIGDQTDDDILDQIFGQFCIGK
jgi:tRNA modification GTPase